MKKPTITFSDFQKLDLRVGQIKEANNIEGSINLLSLIVDFGEDYGVVEILSGIAKFYKPEDIINKKFIFLTNLEPKPMMGKVSNGIILAADNLNQPIILPVPDDLPNGTIVR